MSAEPKSSKQNKPDDAAKPRDDRHGKKAGEPSEQRADRPTGAGREANPHGELPNEPDTRDRGAY